MNRRGFTLIELLIVVIIIGVLVAIAIPKFALMKEKAYIASMKTDLRNLVMAEEAYFADSLAYTRSTGCATPVPGDAAAFCTSGANVLSRIKLAQGGKSGWTASMTNPNTVKSCAVYVGDVTDPANPATSSDAPGTPICR
ncbi:MAG TPA: prepilin-type N-terminal cleavage/methylation domain-containing protein [Gemmatimonadales bacterium]|nr:prepilin-type N-terminal cleavage/methylation domain-containing protein [Gemmatimonadales bacterium]